MKYTLDMQDMTKIAEKRGYERGYKRGVFKGSLKVAKDMIDDFELDELSTILELPIECVYALKDGCSIDVIMEQYGDFD